MPHLAPLDQGQRKKGSERSTQSAKVIYGNVDAVSKAWSKNRSMPLKKKTKSLNFRCMGSWIDAHEGHTTKPSQPPRTCHESENRMYL